MRKQLKKFAQRIFFIATILSLLFLTGCFLTPSDVQIVDCKKTQKHVPFKNSKRCSEYIKEDRSGVGSDTSKLVFKLEDVKIESVFADVQVTTLNDSMFDLSLLAPFGFDKINSDVKQYKKKYVKKDTTVAIYLIQVDNVLYGMIRNET